MLALLDIDGTLCDTFNIDSDCFVESLRLCFGFTDVNTDWNSYPEATDSAILKTVFSTRLNRNPTAIETEQMVDCFHGLLSAAFGNDQCKAIDGGPSFISNLRMKNLPFAVATGGWRRTAILKLKSAGYGDLDFPISTADDAMRRTDICKLAVDAAFKLYGESLTPIIYIGDGLWDQQAAKDLGYFFVGRSTDKMKFNDGCAFAIEDFCDPNLTERLLALQVGA